jgi:hypothetical protein
MMHKLTEKLKEKFQSLNQHGSPSTRILTVLQPTAEEKKPSIGTENSVVLTSVQYHTILSPLSINSPSIQALGLSSNAGSLMFHSNPHMNLDRVILMLHRV